MVKVGCEVAAACHHKVMNESKPPDPNYSNRDELARCLTEAGLIVNGVLASFVLF